MRRRRVRGLGCLGCLPFGGLLFVLLPVFLIVAVIYLLVNRGRQNQNQPYPAPPAGGTPPQTPRTVDVAGYCPKCGAATSPGTKFCASCGNSLM